MTRSWMAWALLVGCGGKEDSGDPDLPCTPLVDIEIIDVDGVDNPERVSAIRGAIEAFEANTGRACLNVDRIEIVRDLPPPDGYDVAFDPRGIIRHSQRLIQLERRISLQSLPQVTTHELCHGLDHMEQLTEQTAEVWEPIGEFEYPDGYPESSAGSELFARHCEEGPSDPKDRTLAAHYELEIAPRQRYLDEIVYVDAPGLVDPLRFDMEVSFDLEQWTLPTADEAYLEWYALTEDGLAVLMRSWTGDNPEGSLAVHFVAMDPLREVAVVPVRPFGDDAAWYPYGLWSGQHAIYLGDSDGDYPWVKVSTDGEVEILGVQGNESFAPGYFGVVLDGVGIGGDDVSGDTIAVDMDSGTEMRPGLPPRTVVNMGWVQDGHMAVLSSGGVWRGSPQTQQWWFDPHRAEGRPIPYGDQDALGGEFIVSEYGGETILVQTDGDGVDHYPADLVSGRGQPMWANGGWRLVDIVDGQVQVMTFLR